MSATYEPGTVAIATVRGVPNVRIVRTASSRDLWFSAESHGPYRDGVDSIKWHEAPTQVTDIRPLVVLDPSEFIAENLVPLLLATAKKGTEGLYARRSAVRFVADQIEAQTRPPKPAEPTGLGAVVEDAKGRRWVLADPENPPSWTLANESDTTWEKYRDIDAVRVLSEGVTA